MSLEYLLYGNQFYPQGVDAFVTPFLDATQKKIWQGTQKVGGIGGLGGVLGGFMMDNDALDIELGEARNAAPDKKRATAGTRNNENTGASRNDESTNAKRQDQRSGCRTVRDPKVTGRAVLVGSPPCARSREACLMSKLQIVGRLLLVASALALVGAGRPARAQDDDEPVENENANAQAVNNLRVAVIAQAPNLEQMDQWVFGRYGGSGGAHSKLDSSLLLRIQDLERTCGITEAQKMKLRLAGRGDIKRFFDRLEELKRKLQQGQNDPNANIWQAIQPLQVELNTGLFGDDSLYAKTIKRTLNERAG